MRELVVLPRHVYTLWRAGQLRFRLETFGLWYPALPYQAPWWHISPRVAVVLLRQMRSYARWLIEMEELRRGGPEAWWRRQSLRRPDDGR